MSRTTAICAVLAVLAISIGIGVYLGHARIECEARGGVLVRGTGDGPQCVEAQP